MNQSDPEYSFWLFPANDVIPDDVRIIQSCLPRMNMFFLDNSWQKKEAAARLAEQKRLIPHVITEAYQTFIEQKTAEFMNWAEINKGNEHNLKHLLKEQAWFTDETDITAIKSSLKKESASGSGAGGGSWEKDLLFLQMARIHDEQNENINQEMENIRRRQSSLFADLKGDPAFLEIAEEHSGPFRTGREDFFMIERRIKAYSRIVFGPKDFFKPQGKELLNPLLITADEEVFSFVESSCTNFIKLLDIDKLKVHENNCSEKDRWQEQFADFLADAVSNRHNDSSRLKNAADDCSLKGRVRLGVILEKDVKSIFDLDFEELPVCLIRLSS